MGNKLPQFPKVTLVLGAAMVTLLCLPCPTHAQSSTSSLRKTVRLFRPRKTGRVPKAMTSHAGTWHDLISFSIAIAKLPNKFAKRRPCSTTRSSCKAILSSMHIFRKTRA